MDRILIVEDEEKLARFLELELAHEGYAVEKAFDGRTGLDLAENGGFDLILLDVMLPGMSGLEVLRRLRRTDAVPVIVLTARDAVMAQGHGAGYGRRTTTSPSRLKLRNCSRAFALRFARAGIPIPRPPACSFPAG